MANNYSPRFHKLKKQILKREGGFIPNDNGFPCYKGIRLNTYAEYLGKDINEVTVEQLKGISQQDIDGVYHSFYRKVGGDEVSSEKVSTVLFDQVFNKGPSFVNRVQQTYGDAKNSNGFSSSTISKLNDQNEKEAAVRLIERERENYIRIAENKPDQRKNLSGWLTRIEDLYKTVGETAPKRTEREKLLYSSSQFRASSRVGSKAYTGLAGDEINDSFVEDNSINVSPGDFRINDILFSIPPEAISIMVDENENSVLLMRQETPAVIQSGKKRIRVVVNFSYDASYYGYEELAKLLIQIRKTPIATIENEKIRKELFGDTRLEAGLGVVVDSISGYVDDDLPDLLRLTLQMSWFNHYPYVNEISYLDIDSELRSKSQTAPSKLYEKFYREGTTFGNSFINDPAGMVKTNSLVILYKEYIQAFSKMANKADPNGSQLNSVKNEPSLKQRATIDEMIENGWYLAEGDYEPTTEISGIFYRWKKFEIPYNEIEASGVLLLQNMSFAMNTNPVYIPMEGYSIPTIQFLNGTTTTVRAMLFAGAEHEYGSRVPVGTSDNLAKLLNIIKSVSQDRITYSKFSKENHLLIAHPIAKLMKYRSFQPNTEKAIKPYKFKYHDSEVETSIDFSIDDYLPVVVSNFQSSTIESLPFASRLQMDFLETRMEMSKNAIKYDGVTEQVNVHNIQVKIIEKIFQLLEIAYDKNKKEFYSNKFSNFYKTKGAISIATLSGVDSQDIDNVGYPLLDDMWKLMSELNDLAAVDYSVVDLTSMLASSVFKENKSGGMTKQSSKQRYPIIPQSALPSKASTLNTIAEVDEAYKRGEITISQAMNFRKTQIPISRESYVTGEQQDAAYLRGDISLSTAMNLRKTTSSANQTLKPFSYIRLNGFILDLYSQYCQDFIQGKPWCRNFIDLFEEYAKVTPKGIKDIYQDMMIPDEFLNPAFYFSDTENRVKNYKAIIGKNLAANQKEISENIFFKMTDDNPPLTTESKDRKPGTKVFPTSINNACLLSSKNTGISKFHAVSDPDFRFASLASSVDRMTPPSYSLKQVYPAFRVQLYTNRYSFFQKFSSSDIKLEDELKSGQPRDILDIFDLSSILDIRIIKDEYEAADLMIIRILGTDKTKVNTKNQDPNFNVGKFGFEKLIDTIKNKNYISRSTYDNNLEMVGLKEGIRIRAFLGNSNDLEELTTEFTGRIAAINGRDIIEIYCLGDGHELIQNTLGYDKNKADSFTWNSETRDILRLILDQAKEVQSFGNTRFEITDNINAKFPNLMGGISALDNIYSPPIHSSGAGSSEFGLDIASNFLNISSTSLGLGMFISAATNASLAGVIAGTATSAAGIIGATSLLAGLATIGLGVGAVAVAGATWAWLDKTFAPAPYTAYQQTIWDVLQELTLRHPGFIASIVPFDSRSTIYFGEPDGSYFFRGPQGALEKSLKIKSAKKFFKYFPKNATMREIYDELQKAEELRSLEQIEDPTSNSGNKIQKKKQTNKDKSVTDIVESTDINLLAIMSMQKTFRNYHLVTSEHDIVSNSIEASSVDVANSVQVYHPKKAGDANPDGKTWFSSYELTDPMEADDNLHNNSINNKIFTFHNAHDKFPEIDLPERYAKGILCKELSNIYKGKLTVLGRGGIKPHDIVILRDTHNSINGPIGVRRVVQTVSPSTGWITSIYPKFIAIPDNSISAYQMKTILSASRFWLGDEVDLFYSSMRKFIPNETDSGSTVRNGDIAQAIEHALMENQEAYQNQITSENKEDASVFGAEYILSKEAKTDIVSEGSFLASTTLAGSFTGKKFGIKASNVKVGPKEIVTGKSVLGRSMTTLANSRGEIKAAKGIMGTGIVATKVAARFGSGLFGLIAPFAVDYVVESAMDGMINYFKYRQPISIFPLTKDGSPWMAGLGGFRENTPIDSIKIQLMEGADRLSAISALYQEIYSKWAGEVKDTGNTITVDTSKVSVTDGDTFNVTLSDGSRQAIRLLGFDTGEIRRDGNPLISDAENEIGGLATKKLKSLLAKGKKVEIMIKGVEGQGRNRLLGHVKIDGVPVFQEMIKSGLAVPYTGFKKEDKKTQAAEIQEAWATKLIKYKENNRQANE